MPGSSAKAFLLALGLGITLAGPVSARDRAVAPAGDLRPCPSEGAGFVQVPGTTTCLRLSGRVAAGLGTGRRNTAPLAQDRLSGDRLSRDHQSMGRLSIDTRTATDYGPVRAFVRMGAGRP